ncbi:hypothetical protein Tco_0494531 [Tanacetum coccineum]
MLEIKVYEIGGQQEIFTSKAWRRLFDISEKIYIELYHEFYFTYAFDKDLYDRMGNMEIRQGTLERMVCRQLYHTAWYAGLFKHMVGHYGYTLQGAYAPRGYDEEQQDDEKLCRDDTVGFYDCKNDGKELKLQEISVKYSNGC